MVLTATTVPDCTPRCEPVPDRAGSLGGNLYRAGPLSGNQYQTGPVSGKEPQEDDKVPHKKPPEEHANYSTAVAVLKTNGSFLSIKDQKMALR